MPEAQDPNPAAAPAGEAWRQGPALIGADDLVVVDGQFGPMMHQCNMRVEELGRGQVVVRLPYSPALIRPGGTISGPAIMTLTDYALYIAVLSAIGLVELAVTTNLNINFLRKPDNTDLLAEARLIKLGRRLAVGEVWIHADGKDESLVAHATGTYSIPPDRAG